MAGSTVSKFLLLFLLTFPFLAAASPTTANLPAKTDPALIGQPAMRLFTNRDGLPQNTIHKIAVDSKGYLWIATADGAAYYNGREWQIVNMPNYSMSNDIFALITSSDGSIWFGTNGGGVSQLKDGKWTTYTKANGLPSNLIFSLLETRSKDGKMQIWAGTFGSGVACLEDGKWTVYSKKDGLGDDVVFALLETKESDGSSVIWAGTYNGGVSKFAHQVWSSYDERWGLPSREVRSLLATKAEDGSNIIWAGTVAGLAKLETKISDQWTVYTTQSGLPNNRIWSLIETRTRDGKSIIWAGTNGGGLAKLERGRWRVYDSNNGLPNNLIYTILEAVSKEGRHTLWVGLEGGGLVRIEEDKWISFNRNSGLPNNEVLSILGSKKTPSLLWVGTYGGGLARLEDGKWTIYDKTAGLSSDIISALLETTSEEGTTKIWVGTASDGLCLFEKGEWLHYTTRDGLCNNEVRSLLETDADIENSVSNKQKTLWVGTFDGLSRYEKGVWRTYRTTDGLPNNGVNVLLETRASDGTRTLWVGTYGGGLGKYEKGTWTVYNLNNGLPSNIIFSLLETVSEDGERFLWVGTNGGGVARLKLGTKTAKWEIFSTASLPAIANNTIYQIQEDRKGQIYLLTNKGVIRLTPNSTGSYKVYRFTTEDGLPSNECKKASTVDSVGRIWVGTVGGLAVFDPEREVKDISQKQLYLNFKKGSDWPSLAYNNNNITFESTLLSFYKEDQTRYRTQLEGLDPEPSEWTSDYKRTYTNLLENSYIFKVWARDYAGNISGPIVVNFRVRPAPWRTWWAYTLYFITVLGFAFRFYSWRIGKVEKKQREKIDYLQQLLESTRTINSQLDLSTVLKKIVEESAQLIDCEPGGIGLVDGDQVVFNHIWFKDHWENETAIFKLGEGIAGRVALSASAMIVNNPEFSTDVAFINLMQKYSISGLMDLPIISRNGKVVGVLDVRRQAGRRPFNDTDRKLLESFAHQAAVAIENASLYGELEEKSEVITRSLKVLEEKNLMILNSMKELERLYKKEQELTRALQELDRMKDNFLAVTSHEMRTPLTVLKGHTELLLDQILGPIGQPQEKALITCERMIDRMSATFDDILEMLKVHEGHLSL
ncbi:MAG: GAF domain-containing protein, partial [Blastocatellia bacterium]|nr:GAF domain-containing protein [Blastocatellia bacterium]